MDIDSRETSTADTTLYTVAAFLFLAFAYLALELSKEDPLAQRREREKSGRFCPDCDEPKERCRCVFSVPSAAARGSNRRRADAPAS